MVTGFEDMKESWGAAGAWYYERSWKAIGKDEASVVVDSPGLMPTHANELRLGTMKRAYKKLLAKPSCSRKHQYIGRCQYHGKITKNSSHSGVNQPELRVLQRTELEKWCQPFEGSQTLEQETVTLKLPWRPQDIRDARTMGYLLRKAANRE